MAMKWSDVAASSAFQALSFDEQEEARNQYFNEVVAPQVSKEEIDAVRGEVGGLRGEQRAAVEGLGRLEAAMHSLLERPA